MNEIDGNTNVVGTSTDAQSFNVKHENTSADIWYKVAFCIPGINSHGLRDQNIIGVKPQTKAVYFPNLIPNGVNTDQEVNRDKMVSEPIMPGGEGLEFDPASLHYDMSGDKFLTIFNQYTYKTKYYKVPPSTRVGTQRDVRALGSLFEGLGFKVKVHDDLTADEIMETLEKVASGNHTRTSCICIAILTHGHQRGLLCAADRPFYLHNVLNKFKNRPELVNKPKLFFIQACRGDKIDSGVKLDGETVVHVPSYADFLILRATVEDYVSWRCWMIQILCLIIANHHEELDLLQMITLMNRKMTYEREKYQHRIQMPETKFMLTKLLKFKKKINVDSVDS